MAAVDEIGVSVLHGAISTFLAVIVMSFGSTYVFEVFFKLFFGIIVFGITHGMMLLPVILSLIEKCEAKCKAVEKESVREKKLDSPKV